MCQGNKDTGSLEAPESFYQRRIFRQRRKSEKKGARHFEKLYKVSSILGKGGFGTVYAGVSVQDGRKVAIKQIAKNRVSEMVMVRIISTLFCQAQPYQASFSSSRAEISFILQFSTHPPPHPPRPEK